MTDDIVEFIRARLAEDEQSARAAFSGQVDPENGWGSDGRAVTPHVGVIHEDVQRAHVVKWNPARVLRGVDAKRRLLDMHRPNSTLVDQWTGCRHCADSNGDAVRWPCPTARVIAIEWAAHADYRKEWTP